MRVNYQKIVPNMKRQTISELMQIPTETFITLPFAFLKKIKRVIFWAVEENVSGITQNRLLHVKVEVVVSLTKM